MRIVFDDISKYLVEFDDNDIDSNADVKFINKLTKADVAFEVYDNENQVLVYREVKE